MALLDLNERAKEIATIFTNPYGLVKTETRGETDLAACLAVIMEKITSAYVSKYEKAEHPTYPGTLKDEVFLTEGYIALLHLCATQGFILENMKVVGKNRNNISSQIVDIINTLSKIGKLNQAISDHSLASRTINQILVYAERNDYDIERLYQSMREKMTGANITKLAS